MANLVPEEGSGFETAGSVGDWSPWYSCTLSQTTAEHAFGTGSMAVAAADAFWGVNSSTWPGWPGVEQGTTYTVSIRFKGAATVEGTLHWRDEGGADLATEVLNVIGDAATWKSASVASVPPSGTTHVTFDLNASGATSGVTYYVDAIKVESIEQVGAQAVVRVFRADAWQAVPVKVWDGAAWVECPAMVQ